MLPMPIAGVMVLDAVGFEQHGVVDELGLFGAGVVPEGVGVPEADVGRVLEGASSVGAGGEGEKPAAGGEAAVGFLHGVDRVAEMFEGVVGADDADLAVFEGPALVEVSCDVGVLKVDGFVSGGRVEAAAEVDLAEAIQVAPAFNEGVDVLVVDVQRFGLNERVLVAATCVGGMDVVDVEAAFDVLHSAMDVRAAEQIVIVEDGSSSVVATDTLIEGRTPGSDVVGGEPDLGERPRGRLERDAFELRQAIPRERAITPAELLVVLPGFAVMDLACVGVREVDPRFGERSCEFGEAVGGEFVVVIDLDQDIASAGMARELFEFADVLGLAGLGDDPGLGEIDADLARIAVGDDHPLEVGVSLPSDRAGQAVEELWVVSGREEREHQ